MEKVFIQFFESLAARGEYLLPYEKRSASCEKWIQGEFIHYLNRSIQAGTVIDADLEKNYGPRAGLCDIWFRTKDKEFWCELEVIVTNYRKPGKPITNQVDHVIDDIQKLEKCPAYGAEKFVVFLVYPLSWDGSNEDIWSNRHMVRIGQVAQLLMAPHVIALDSQYEARIYIAAPKRPD